MRYLERIARQGFRSPGQQMLYEKIMEPATRRVIFDCRQAALLADSGAVPHHIQGGLRLPFEQFWLEFDMPVAVGPLHSGDEGYLRALLVGPYGSHAALPPGMAEPIFVMPFAAAEGGGEDDCLVSGLVYDLANGNFLDPSGSGDDDDDDAGLDLCPRCREYDLDTSDAMHICYSCGWTPGASTDLDDTGQRLLPKNIRYTNSDCPFCGAVAELLGWLLTYMMAKGIRIAPEHLSRQQARLMARKRIPNPWHIVTVEPRVGDEEETITASDGEGPGHGYRYDVMGHLRFGRHKLGDGSHRNTVEWVRPHQRGLRHELYVPKTSRFRAANRPHPRLAEWWRQ